MTLHQSPTGLTLGSPRLRAVSNWLNSIATRDRPCYPQGWRARVQYLSIAIGWLCKGNHWDTRTLRQRIADSRYYWARAIGASHTWAVARYGFRGRS